MPELMQLLQTGGDVGGFLLVWILWQQHQRVNRLERVCFGV